MTPDFQILKPGPDGLSWTTVSRASEAEAREVFPVEFQPYSAAPCRLPGAAGQEREACEVPAAKPVVLPERPPGPEQKPRYFPAIDAARFLASVGVIWNHASIDVSGALGEDTGIFGRFRVPFFTLVAVFFAVTGVARAPKRGFGSYFVSRFARIYIPLAAWSAIYLGFKLLQNMTLGRREAVELQWDLLWGGAAYHLWFLPFILVTTWAVYPVARLTAGTPRGTRCALALGVVLGVVAALVPLPLDWLWSYRATNLIYSLWALPSVFWGIALACLYSRGKEGDLYRGSGYAYFGLGLLLVCTLALAFTSSDRLVENLSGLGLALFAFSNLRGKVINLLARLGKLSFGIYLSHVLFLGACRAIATRVGFDTTLGFAILATAVTLACSSVLTGLLLKSPGLRWLGK